MITCSNGHEIAERVQRSDGCMVCPVCLRESVQRRSARYAEKHREKRREASRARNQRYRERQRLERQQALQAVIDADVAAMRERVAVRRAKRELQRRFGLVA